MYSVLSMQCVIWCSGALSIRDRQQSPVGSSSVHLDYRIKFPWTT